MVKIVFIVYHYLLLTTTNTLRFTDSRDDIYKIQMQISRNPLML